MKAIIGLLQALCLLIPSVVGEGAAAVPSVYVALVSPTTAANAPAATGSPSPGFRWLGLGQKDRLEVNADFANKKENVGAVVFELLSAGKNQFNNGTIAVVLQERVFRKHLIETLSEPMLLRRKAKYGKFIELMFQKYQEDLQPCTYKGCEAVKCRYPVGTDRQERLLRESCIGKRNMARYEVLKADYETMVEEVEHSLANTEQIPFWAERIDSSIGDTVVEFEEPPELYGDWSCTATRKGGPGCPTIAVPSVSTTLTGTVIKTHFGLEGLASKTYLHPQTFLGTEYMHAEYPLVTGTSENGPDADQIERDPAPQHMWEDGR